MLILGGHEFHVPDFVFEEIAIHQDEVLPRSGLAPEAFDEVLRTLRSHVQEHSVGEYGDHIEKALQFMGDRDPKDAPYFALALFLHADAVWSQDRRLESVSGIAVIRTADLLRLESD